MVVPLGSLQLVVPESIAANRRVLATMHMVRFDLVPWPGRLSVAGNCVSLLRNVGHSGMVLLAYPVPGYGEVTLRTGTLPERPTPYHLPIELARGTLDRLRNQMSLWSESGLVVPPPIIEQTDRAVERFSAALFLETDPERQTAAADECLAICCPLIDALCREFAQQFRQIGKHDSHREPGLGIRITPEQFSSTWLAELDPAFRYVEVAGWSGSEFDPDDDHVSPTEIQTLVAASHRRSMIGPLWDAGPRGLPDRINQIQEFDRKRIEALQYFGQLLSDIRVQPDWLHIASGLNGVGHRFLSFPQQIQLVVDLQHLVDEFNRDVPVLISFAQPWGERLAWSVGGAQGIQIADLLLRNDIRLSGFGLEFDLDYWPNGSLLRDPLQWLDLVDTWAQFGMPLFIFLRAPSGYTADQVAGDASDRTPTIRASFGETQLCQHLAHVTSLLLARPVVEAIIWSEWRDSPESEYPAAGLADAQGHPKALYHHLRSTMPR